MSPQGFHTNFYFSNVKTFFLLYYFIKGILSANFDIPKSKFERVVIKIF